jgi:uncharacterized membrane-anchored protein
MARRFLTAAFGGVVLSLLPLAPAVGQDAEGPTIPWEEGPTDGRLGPQSKISVAEGCLFTGIAGTEQFLTLTQNPTNGRERGTAVCPVRRTDGEEGEWFAVFEYDESGYVRDTEKGTLDADALLASLKRGNAEGNKARRARGWETIELVGWERPPYYDPETNNLTWATRVRDEGGVESINHSVRLLGRGGVMSVDLVTDPQSYEASLPEFGRLISSHAFEVGFRYAEWREGDKVAAYGLTALVAGGAGALAAKSGVLGKLWKAIVGAAVAAFAGLKRLFSRKKE